MYNTNYKLYYKNKIDDTSDDTDALYRHDLVEAFNLQDLFYTDEIDSDKFNFDPFFKELTNKTDKLYETFKDNQQIIELMEEVKQKTLFPMGTHDNQSLFFYLFSFEYFYLFHECLKDLFNSGTISTINYDDIMKKIKEN